jgi:hypothetical protein
MEAQEGADVDMRDELQEPVSQTTAQTTTWEGDADSLS